MKSNRSANNIDRAIIVLKNILKHDKEQDIINSINQFKNTGNLEIEMIHKLNEYAK